jgi:hypothetical protein
MKVDTVQEEEMKSLWLRKVSFNLPRHTKEEGAAVTKNGYQTGRSYQHSLISDFNS